MAGSARRATEGGLVKITPSKRLKDIAHDLIRTMGDAVESTFVKMEALPELTTEESEAVLYLKRGLGNFRAELDEFHSDVESGNW